MEMLPESLAPSYDSLPPTSARVSIAPKSGVQSCLTCAGDTNVGRKRKLNEDQLRMDPGLSLYVVCDGMGGHAAGDVASNTAVRVFCAVLKENEALVRSYVGVGNRSVGATKRDIVQLLHAAVNQASAAVFAEAQVDTSKRGMGTTLVATLILGNHAFITHVGDSRAYLLRGGNLEQLTRDHNVFNDFVRNKKLTAEAARQAAPKSAITRAVGVYEHCQPDIMVLDVAAGDRLLLCTDGLSDYFEDTVGEYELAVLLAEPNADSAVAELIAAANERGGKDNISVLITTLGEVGCHDSAELSRLEAGRWALSQSRVFELLDERQLLQVLELTETVTYQARQVVVEIGESGDEMYIILSGAVDVYRGDSRVAHMKAGDHFGEMALVRDMPRSAQAIAVEDSELLVIPTPMLFQLLQGDMDLGVKLLWCLTSVLADRLATTTRDLSESRESEASPDFSREVLGDEDDEDRRPTLRPPPNRG